MVKPDLQPDSRPFAVQLRASDQIHSPAPMRNPDTNANMSDQLTHQSLTRRLIKFRDDRDWRQFHSLKDLIVSLNLEAAELLELTQWQKDDAFEAAAAAPDAKNGLAEECADIFLYLLLICERSGIDLAKAADDKITSNELKYPVEKSKGRATKYNRL